MSLSDYPTGWPGGSGGQTLLLHPSLASHRSISPGAQVKSGAPYPGSPQYKELGVNGWRDCVPCVELWERSVLVPSKHLLFPLANINHSH